MNRISSDVERARFTVDEVVNLTLDFYRRNYIEGCSFPPVLWGIRTTPCQQMIDVAKRLRMDHSFKGYIHLKTIPGAADELLAEAGLHADRLSVNIELPTVADLEKLAPEKKRASLEKNMAEVKLKSDEFKEDKKRGLKAPVFAPAGQTTQMIVGATPTADHAILTTASTLYESYKLRRVYYSAFSPIPHADSKLPGISPPLMREHRLYQADWLLRFTGITWARLSARPPLISIWKWTPKRRGRCAIPGIFRSMSTRVHASSCCVFLGSGCNGAKDFKHPAL